MTNGAKKIILYFTTLSFVMLSFLGCGSTDSVNGTVNPNHITGEQLQRTGCTSILGALQGLVPGLNITGNDFDGYSTIIRGRNSLKLDSTPLFVVDGVIVQSLDIVNIYDVDYVEIVKNATMYGSRGANGAIEVYTKRGKADGKPSVTVDYSTGTYLR